MMYKTFTTLAALLLFASNAALAAPSAPVDRRGPSSVKAREGSFKERSANFVDKRVGGSESIWNISYERTQGHNMLTFFPSKTLLSEISVYNLNADRY